MNLPQNGFFTINLPDITIFPKEIEQWFIPSDPFAKGPLVICENITLRKIFEKKIAEQINITAGTSFIYPAQSIRTILSMFPSVKELLTKEHKKLIIEDEMSALLYPWFASLPEKDISDYLKRLLQPINSKTKEKNIIYLCRELSHLFVKYADTVPDMLLTWKVKNKDHTDVANRQQKWQRDAWHYLFNENSDFIDNASCFNVASTSNAPQCIFPTILYIGTLPTSTLLQKSLTLLSKTTPVFWLHPTGHLPKINNSSNFVHWFPQAKTDFPFYKDNTKTFEIEQPISRKGTLNNLTKVLIGEIDTLSEKERFDNFSIYATSGLGRQAELIKDIVLNIIKSNKDNIKPGDIGILLPNVETVAPFLETVMDGFSDELKVSWNIQGRKTGDATLLDAFYSLINLAGSDLHTESVINFLSNPCIMESSQYSNSELEEWISYISELNISRSAESSHREITGLPKERHGTWQQGGDRILFGLLTADDQTEKTILPSGETDTPILPYLNLSIDRGESFLRLSSIIDALYQDIIPLSGISLTLAQWADLFRELLTNWISPRYGIPDDLQAKDQLNSSLHHLAVLGALQIQKNKNSLFSLQAALSFLGEQIKLSNEQHTSPLTTMVTCGSLPDLSAVSFRHTIIAALDEGAWPKHENEVSFDLIPKEKISISKIERERIAFTKAIFSTKEQLYLIYNGRDSVSGAALQPAGQLAELLNTITDPDVRSKKIIHIPLLKFNKQNFIRENNFPLSFNKPAMEIHTANNKHPLTQSKSNKKIESTTPKETILSVDINDIRKFLENPAKEHLLNSEIRLREPKTTSLQLESEECDPMTESSSINNFLISPLLSGNFKDPEIIFEKMILNMKEQSLFSETALSSLGIATLKETFLSFHKQLLKHVHTNDGESYLHEKISYLPNGGESKNILTAPLLDLQDEIAKIKDCNYISNYLKDNNIKNIFITGNITARVNNIDNQYFSASLGASSEEKNIIRLRLQALLETAAKNSNEPTVFHINKKNTTNESCYYTPETATSHLAILAVATLINHLIPLPYFSIFRNMDNEKMIKNFDDMTGFYENDISWINTVWPENPFTGNTRIGLSPELFFELAGVKK